MPIDQLEQRRAVVAAKKRLDEAEAAVEAKNREGRASLEAEIAGHRKAIAELENEIRGRRADMATDDAVIAAYADLGEALGMLEGEVVGYDETSESFSPCRLTGFPMLESDVLIGDPYSGEAILLAAIEVAPGLEADAAAMIELAKAEAAALAEHADDEGF
jgi:hypothetical protein